MHWNCIHSFRVSCSNSRSPMCVLFSILVFALICRTSNAFFAPAPIVTQSGCRLSSACATGKSALSMGLFDMFAPKKSAAASHILVKGSNAETFLNNLKADLEKSKDMPTEFATAAAQHSACPSGQRGGSLGTFKQGQMVPAFDKVVFSEEIGKIHGPVKTPFGAHLILIEAREE
mmetsp:Transcript_12559/g.20895  ORF Transcript_12559/g.20895 Transcript_12559/m.20895 type:complete len:175 (-) Transcript_12559:752-1276(-)